MKLENKVFIISGASSGIGYETAKALKAEGATVVGFARRIEKLQSLTDLGVEIHQADVTKFTEVSELVEKTVAKYGQLDGIINNAGVGHLGPFEEGKIAEWDNMIDVNLKGLLYCIHAALPHLKATQGHIVNLASVAAHAVNPLSVVYSATKFGVAVISEGMRKELGNKVKITQISPGAVETEFVSHTSHEKTLADFTKYFEAGALKASDIADAILGALTANSNTIISEIIIRPNR